MKRRDLIKNLGLLSLSGGIAAQSPLLAQTKSGDLAAPASIPDQNSIYESIGVRPVINGRGTITVIGGSRLLPEVQEAMDRATKDYVEFDELMEGVGRRLSELTGAEWGMVTTGAAGAMVLATTGILTGGNPDKLGLLPNLSGMKSEVIIPDYSWTAYAASIAGVGVKMITVRNKRELELAVGPNTAMVMVLAGSKSEDGPLSTREIASVTKPLNIPILVDAAAEGLPLPNPHIEQGADLVTYSGGKYLRGPQCAGLLIGRKDLVKAAWVTSAPHHGYARGYKVGREEIMGMLAAVEMWRKRDLDAEIRQWTKELEYVAGRLKRIPGITTNIRQPVGRSNPSPGLRVEWDMNKIPLTGQDVEKILWDGNPRVAVSGAGSFLPFPPNTQPNIYINTSQLNPGEEKIIADRVYAVLSKPPKITRPSGAPAADISGVWDFEIAFTAEKDVQRLALELEGNDLKGTHFGEFAARDLSGSVYGKDVLIRSSYTKEGVRLNFQFTGTIQDAQTMAGDLSLGEYGKATWQAKRREFEMKG